MVAETSELYDPEAMKINICVQDIYQEELALMVVSKNLSFQPVRRNLRFTFAVYLFHQKVLNELPSRKCSSSSVSWPVSE